MKNITNEEKVAQLLCISIGSTHYNNLGSERPIKGLFYDELLDVLKQMLIPKKSVALAQHYFLNNYQKEQQSISEFVAAVQCGVTECEFSVKYEYEKCANYRSLSKSSIYSRFT